MLDIFKAYLKNKSNLTDQDLEKIALVCQEKKLKKRQFYLKAGEICRYNAFVCKGFLRYYHVDDRGQEHIIQFAPENYWTGDRESLENNAPSKFYVDAIEDSEILLIEKEDFEMLRNTIPAYNDFVNATIKRNLMALQDRIQANITLNTEEKYKKFIKQFPSITKRVPLLMIASYLGVSAETLSRIRSSVAKS